TRFSRDWSSDVCSSDLNFSTNINNAGLVQFAQCTFTNVWNIGGDFLTTQLGITSDTRQFLDMNRGKAVFLYNPLGYQDGVLVVVSVPRHKGDAHVLAKRQFTHIHRRTICKDIATGNYVAHIHNRTLVNTGILV